MTCAKATVRCVIVTRSGARIEGSNACANPQTVCPRAPGEDYTKCSTICQQGGHAEAQAVKRALPSELRGAHAYLKGHTYACRDCQEALFGAGVAALSIGEPPL